MQDRCKIKVKSIKTHVITLTQTHANANFSEMDKREKVKIKQLKKTHSYILAKRTNRKSHEYGANN